MAYTRIVGIYRIRCLPSGRVYIGQSVNIKARWALHRGQLRAGTHGNPIMRRSFNKYGPDAFEFTVLTECADADLDASEKAHIAAAKNELGEAMVMNIGEDVRNPMKGRHHTAEARHLLSERFRGIPRGPMPAETRRRLSEAKRGHRPTPENVAKAALARVGLVRSQSAKDKTAATHRGMKRSAEACARMSASAKGRVISLEHRAKLSAALKGRAFTPEHRARAIAGIRAAHARKVA